MNFEAIILRHRRRLAWILRARENLFTAKLQVSTRSFYHFVSGNEFGMRLLNNSIRIMMARTNNQLENSNKYIRATLVDACTTTQTCVSSRPMPTYKRWQRRTRRAQDDRRDNNIVTSVSRSLRPKGLKLGSRIIISNGSSSINRKSSLICFRFTLHPVALIVVKN